MRDRIYEIRLNDKLYEKPKYKQYDNDIPFRFRIVENGVDVALTGYTVRAFFDNKHNVIQKNCTVRDRIIETKLDNNILAYEGEVKVEITLTKENQIVTTFTITIIVEKSINRNDAVELDPGWDILKDFQTILDNAISEANRELENAINKAEEDVDNAINNIPPKSELMGGQGPIGPQGEKGDKPRHKWVGTKLQIENPDGTFGEGVDLKGADGNMLQKEEIDRINKTLSKKENKMEFIKVPDNSDLAEYFKNVDTIGTHRVVAGTGVTNTCNDSATNYSFYYVYQTFVLGITDGGKLFKASFINKTLGKWEEVSTNKKTSFKLTPKAGFSMLYQNCYAINNVVYINARVQMTDGSLFQPTSGNRELVTIPTKYCPTDATALQSWAASASTIGLPGASSAAAVPDGRILVVNTGTPKTITISGVYSI